MSVDLYGIYIGEETTRGTGVAATAKLAGFEGAPISPGVEIWRGTEERRGTLVPAYMSQAVKYDPTVSLSGVATWEQIGNVLDALFGKASPVDNLNGTYTRSYSAPLGSKPTLTPWSVYYGDSSDIWRLVGALANEVTFSGSINEVVQVNVNMFGTKVEATTAPSIADPSVTPIFGGAALYIDAASGTIGTTQVTDVVWFEWELNVNPNRANVFGVDSALVKDYRERKWDGTLRLVLSVGGTSKNILNSLIAPGEDKKQIRIKYSLTVGANVWTLQFDFAGVLTEVGDIVEDQDGVASLSLTYSGEYNSNLGNWLKAELTNGVATLP